jgi:Phage integrase family
MCNVRSQAIESRRRRVGTGVTWICRMRSRRHCGESECAGPSPNAPGRACLKAAKLPKHFTPHCLRHTFASLLLQEGESAQYVQEQLGHALLTMDGGCLRSVAAKEGRPRWRQHPWGSIGSNPGSRSTGRVNKTLKKRGEPSGTRTRDPLIKRLKVARWGSAVSVRYT